MSTWAGVGRSTRRGSVDAASEASRQAATALEGGDAELCLVHATARYDQSAVLAAVRAVFPAARISGCSAEGVIAGGHSDESEFSLAVLAIRSDALRFETFLVPGYDADPAGAARTLAEEVAARDAGDGIGLLVFPDGLSGNCEQFLRTLGTSLPRPLTVAGGAAGDCLEFKRTYQYGDVAALSGAVAAVFIRGRGRIETAVSHGCEAIGLERRVTSADGGWVRTIDGEPAWSVFKQYLVGDPQDINTEGAIYLSVGVPFPEGAGEYEPYIIRTPMGLEAATGSMFFPGGGFVGDGRIRITRRDPARVASSARACAERIAGRAAGRRPAFVLQFDCAGRGKQLFGSHVAENIVRPLQESLDPEAPWIGFHTYGEIASIGGRVYYHNLTTALCAVYEDE